MTTAVFEYCIQLTQTATQQSVYKLRADLLQKNAVPVLSRFIENNELYELHCLYAIQKLLYRYEFPAGKCFFFFSFKRNRKIFKT